MKVLVTGAGGFVGYEVAAQLAELGHQVIGLTRSSDMPLPPRVVRHVGDILDPDSLAPALRDVDGICHLAARVRVRESRSDPLGYWRTNVDGTLALLSDADRLERGVRVVLASTAGIYSDQAAQPLGETAELGPASPYARTKLAADLAAADLTATGAIGATSLRTFNVAGAARGRYDRDDSRLIPKLLAVQRGVYSDMVINGDGSAIRDFVHVSDMAAAFVLALEACEVGRSAVYNVGSGNRSSVADVIDTVERVTGRSVNLRHGPPADEPPALLADSARIAADLGWRPKKSDLVQIVSDAWSALNSD